MRLIEIEDYVKSQLENEYSGHDFMHAKRVSNNAKKIIELTNQTVDRDAILIAALTHDVIDEKVTKNVEKSQLLLETFLNDIISVEQTEKVIDIITHISFSKNIDNKQSLTLEGQIVQDADRLDAIGAIGIARAFYFGGSRKELLYSENDQPRQITKENYRSNSSVLQHFNEKLLVLQNSFNTKSAKQIAIERTSYMQEFVDRFQQEISGEK